MACVPTSVNLTSRAKICRTFPYGLCYRENETWTLFSPSILAQILRIGPTGRPLWLRMKNSASMLQATLSFLISLISKRISLSHNKTHDRFVNLGLNSRPTFFGCNASNYTSFRRTPPLVVYFPHTGWTAYTNFSTFTLEYSDADVAAYINNGVATAVSPPLYPFPYGTVLIVVPRE